MQISIDYLFSIFNIFFFFFVCFCFDWQEEKKHSKKRHKRQFIMQFEFYSFVFFVFVYFRFLHAVIFLSGSRPCISERNLDLHVTFVSLKKRENKKRKKRIIIGFGINLLLFYSV